MQSSLEAVDKLMRALGHSNLNITAVLQDGNNRPSNPAECAIYKGNSISKLQIQVVTYIFELSAGNCHR
jgi:hypothetical protein